MLVIIFLFLLYFMTFIDHPADRSKHLCKFVRLRTPERIEALKRDLLNYNWDEVFVDDPNQAYDVFLFTFLRLYNKNCPIWKCKVKGKHNGKPWMTKGLKRACKKKNLLYKKFLQLRTRDSEAKCKLYKNKLITVMRAQKKDYYNKMLDENKSNMQRTLRLIN